MSTESQRDRPKTAPPNPRPGRPIEERPKGTPSTSGTSTQDDETSSQGSGSSSEGSGA